jgi:hypothetical protein
LLGSSVFGSDAIQIGSHEYREEPGATGVLVSKLAKMLERAQYGVLKQIFRIGAPAANQPERRAIQRIKVLADQLLKRSRGC